MYTATMHTGTLIRDLIATVERVERAGQEQEAADQQELHAIFAMQIPATKNDQVFMGAA
jgi:hypothetical protein